MQVDQPLFAKMKHSTQCYILFTKSSKTSAAEGIERQINFSSPPILLHNKISLLIKIDVMHTYVAAQT